VIPPEIGTDLGILPWIGGTGLSGLLLAGLYALLRGRLVAASVLAETEKQRTALLDKMERQWHARLEESKEREQSWRTAWERTEASRAAIESTLDDVLVSARAIEALIRALPIPRQDVV